MRPTILPMFTPALLLLLIGAMSACSYSPKESANTLLTNETFLCQDCNVIIIGMTNVALDHMQVYGYSRETTPFLTEISQKLIIFENAFAQASWTLPSSTTILTSLYPLEHGVMIRNLKENGTYGTIGFRSNKLPKGIVTLPEFLREHGYISAAFTGGFDLKPEHGVVSRFDESYMPSFDAVSGKEPGNPNTQVVNYGSFNFSEPKSAEWIMEHKGEKFFAYIQGFDAHCPFTIPRKNDAFIGRMRSDMPYDVCYWTFEQAVPITINDRVYYRLLSSDITKGDYLFSEEAVKYMVALYDGEIQLVDSYVQRIFSTIERAGIQNNTIVIVLAEHGDLFGKHGRYMRGGPLRGTFYDDVLHVPLMIHSPRNNVSGIRKNQLVELVDIAPTILDMLGIKIPAHFSGKSLQGILTSNDSGKEYVLAGSRYFSYPGNTFYEDSTIVTSIRTKAWKLIQETVLESDFADKYPIKINPELTAEHTKESTVELYHLATDPEELQNVSGSEPVLAAQLRELLDTRIRKMEERKNAFNR